MTRDPIAVITLLFLIALVVAFWGYFFWSAFALWGML